jgi:hypothetical protein
MSYVDTDFDRIREICKQDVATLIVKGKDYGDSWRRRGGVGAFMMLARKWDRIESICSANGYDILEIGNKEVVHDIKDGILDDIADLRCYLLLVEEHIVANSR